MSVRHAPRGKIVFEGDVEEAIGVYMDCNDDIRTSYDYSLITRSINETRKLQLLGLDIVERTENKVKKGELFKFILHCHTNRDVEEIGIRFEIFYLDSRKGMGWWRSF